MGASLLYRSFGPPRGNKGRFRPVHGPPRPSICEGKGACVSWKGTRLASPLAAGVDPAASGDAKRMLGRRVGLVLREDLVDRLADVRPQRRRVADVDVPDDAGL